MRNLSVYFQKYYEEVAPDTKASSLVSIPFTNTDYILSQNGFLFTINTETDDVVSELNCAEQIENETHLLNQTYKFCTYLAESEVLFCGTKEGVIFLVDSNTEDISISGDIEGGIECIEWSPDQEYCVVLGYNGTILLMNSTCEVLYESTIINMSSEDDVLISWRGDNEYFAVNYIDSDTNKRIIMIYKKDLQLHAKVRDLQDMPLENIQSVLSWSTDGSLLATVQKVRDDYKICLIEVNGYKHLEYLIYKYENFVPLLLSWSCQSTYLSLLFSYTQNNQLYYSLTIYTRDNYQLFTKYSTLYTEKPIYIYFDTVSDTQFKILFENTSYIHYFCSVNSLVSHDYSASNCIVDGNKMHITPLQICVPSPPLTSHSLSFPEFMNSFAYQYNTTTSYVPYSLCGLSNTCLYFITIHEPYTIEEQEDVYETPNIPIYMVNKNILNNIKTMTITNTVKLSSIYISKLHSPLFVNELFIYFLCQNDAPGVFKLVEYSIEHKQFYEYLFDVPLISLCYRDDNHILIEDLSGQLYIFDMITKQKTSYMQLACPCSTIINIYSICDDIDIIISLDTNYKLYINNVLITSSVPYVSVLPLYKTIVYIKSLSPPRLCFIPYNQLKTPKLDSEGIPVEPLYSRAIERGSNFIGFGPYDGRVVLQMPRGNYECIYPRFISVAILINMYKQKHYIEMIEKMRREKIPFDLLYDYNPGAFLSLCYDMIKSITLYNRISLVVSNITNVDLMSEGREYASIIKPDNYIAAPEGNKKDIICMCIYNSIIQIEKEDNEKYTSGVYLEEKITCLINKLTPDVIGCLKLIKEFFSINRERAEKALQWLVILSDSQFVYNTCLSIYDIPLCLLIATQSQMDPRDYKPFLNKLYSMNALQQHYEIDKYLNNSLNICKDIYSLLTNTESILTKEDKENYGNEMLSICKAKSLYTECLDLYKSTSYKDLLLKDYANYLITKGEYSEACSIYLSLSLYMQAYDCAIKLGEGVQAITYLYMEKLSEEDIHEMIQELCASFKEGKEKEMEQAAYIYCEYLNDIDNSIGLYLNLKQFITAYNICILKKRTDLIETDINIRVKQNVDLLLQDFKEKSQKMEQCHNRLIEIQKDKQLIQTSQEDDNMSLWSNMTGATGITAISGMTSILSLNNSLDPSLPDVQLNINKLSTVSPISNIDELTHRATSTDSKSQKSTRVMSFNNSYNENLKEKNQMNNTDKKNKKKNKIRKGSKQEEESLRLMVDIIMNRDKLRYQEEIHQTTTILIYMKEVQLAQKLQKEFNDYLSKITKLFDEIPTSTINSTNNEITKDDIQKNNIKSIDKETKQTNWEQKWLNYV